MLCGGLTTGAPPEQQNGCPGMKSEGGQRMDLDGAGWEWLVRSLWKRLSSCEHNFADDEVDDDCVQVSVHAFVGSTCASWVTLNPHIPTTDRGGSRSSERY